MDLNVSGFYNILETFGFVQNICNETHQSHHLLDYIIARQIVILYQIALSRISSQILGYFMLICNVYAPIHIEKIAVKAHRRIKDEALAEDLDRFNVDQGCVDVDIMIEQYDKYLSDLIDRHAPKNNILCGR